MVHWQTVTKSMSLAKSIQTSSTVLTKKGCHQSHYSSPSRINKHHHHLSPSTSSQSTHRSQATSSPSQSNTTTTKHHLFNAKPKDSIFNEDDVNQICLHLKNQKLSINTHSHNNHQSQMRKRMSSRMNMEHHHGQNNRNNKHNPCEYKEDEINEAFSKRMPNQMNDILCRSKSMHEQLNINYSINKKHEQIKKEKEIEIDNNLNISNILPGGISMQNIDKFEHDDDEHEHNKYPQNNIVNNHQQQNQDINQDGNNGNTINIKHSPWDDNITWNAINITL